MSQFTRFVSRKVLGVIAVFAVAAVVAVAAAGIAIVRGTTDTVGLTRTQTADTPSPGETSGGRQQLRADLKAARALDGDARRAALADIRTKARNGAYGDRIERRADRREIHHQLFFSLLPDDLQTDLTALRSASADQREQLRKDIMDKALAGDYGADVQKTAEQLRALRQH